MEAASAGLETDCIPDTPSSILWKSTVPSLPTKDVSLARLDPPAWPPANNHSPVRLNMNFGGLHGERLPLLNRVVAFLDGYSGLFMGFEFFYEDGTSAASGSRSSTRSARSTRPCLEMSFVICGAQGERITEIRADQGTMLGYWRFRRLQVGNSPECQRRPC
ncbi:hypothetical protein IMZ48_03985 [Candidatus Bathyarchaeota archaeon]|nr:hypothetical protein [Candidatus Bathyarchaeota archaeon]